jgi:hypothetical protein
LVSSLFLNLAINPTLFSTEESEDEELNIEYVEDLDEEDEEDLEQDMEGEK